MKSLVNLAIWLALTGAVYSQIVFFALNCIFFSENETLKQNNQNEFQNGCYKIGSLNFGMCNFSLKSYLWFWDHSVQLPSLNAPDLKQFKSYYCMTYIWIADMILPNKPIMPRNSTLLKFLTTNSCATLDTPYIIAPQSTRTSPITWFLPVNQTKLNHELKISVMW